jgi:catechol 2,3-dioxygenase-like lactoylglutathione lyase family enzyme
MSERAVTSGAHHIGLTVPNLSETKAFFIDILGFQQVGEKPDYPAAFVSDGTVMITLWQAKEPANAAPFDRKNVIGLHHFALKIDRQDALDALYATLSETPGVEIEFAPESLGGGATRHMMCTIPGGIRTEFIALSA